MKLKQGISLIVLIVTIIVMIIIAGAIIISLNNTNIIEQAEEATKQYEISQEKEMIVLGYSKHQMSKYTDGDNSLTIDGAIVSENENSGWTIKFNKTGNEYQLYSDGRIETGEIEIEIEKDEYDPVVNDENPNDWDFAWVAPTNTAWDNTQYTKEQTLPEHVVAAKFYSNGDETYKLVIEGNGTMPPFFDNPAAPSALYGYQTLSIGALTGGSMEDAIITKVTEILVCDGVTSISDGAFAMSMSLTELKISETVENIGLMSLYASSLQELTIPNGTIIANAFAGSESLTKLTLGSGTTIGNDAFKGCSNIEQLTVWSSTIGEGAFEDCDSLVDVTLKTNVTSIGYQAFNSCNALKNVIIPGTVTSIGDQAFALCPQLENVTLGYGITSIGDLAFNSSAIKKLVLPGSITSMGRAAFSNCYQLSEIILENGITTIGEQAFSVDNKEGVEYILTKVVIPTSVTQIGANAFRNNKNLAEVDWQCTADNVTVGQYAFEGLKNPSTIYVRKQAIKTAVESSGLSTGTIVEIK